MGHLRIGLAVNRAIGLRAVELIRAVGIEVPVVFFSAHADSQYVENIVKLANPRVTFFGRDFREHGASRTIAESGLDYIISVHFPYFIPESVFSVPKVGTLNLHPSLLPFCRGWHTPSWAILDGVPFGATLHWVSEEIDAGDIALQEPLSVHPWDTADTLYRRALDLEVRLLERALRLLLSGTLPRLPQRGTSTAHGKSDLGTLQMLDLARLQTIGETLTLLRALSTNQWSEAAVFEVGSDRVRVKVELQRVNDLLDRDA